MPLPVVADHWQARFVVTGSPLQRPATFALHFRDTTGSQVTANLLTDLDLNASAGMWNLLSSNVGITRIDAIKLDGIAASESVNIGGFPAKWTGSGGADAVLQGAAVLSIRSPQRGPAKRNRAYLGPVAEAKQVDGVLDATTLGLAQTAWNTFRTGMATSGWAIAVVTPSTQTAQDASSILLRPYLKTQRRRARR